MSSGCALKELSSHTSTILQLPVLTATSYPSICYPHFHATDPLSLPDHWFLDHHFPHSLRPLLKLLEALSSLDPIIHIFNHSFGKQSQPLGLLCICSPTLLTSNSWAVQPSCFSWATLADELSHTPEKVETTPVHCFSRDCFVPLETCVVSFLHSLYSFIQSSEAAFSFGISYILNVVKQHPALYFLIPPTHLSKYSLFKAHSTCLIAWWISSTILGSGWDHIPVFSILFLGRWAPKSRT